MTATVKLKPDELAAFKEAFDMFDRKGDGSISTKVGRASSVLEILKIKTGN